MRPRDSQRAKVYHWEDIHLRPLTPEPLTLDEAQALAVEAAALFGVPPPKVEAKHHGHARGGASFIQLPKWALRRSVVLHEVAHSVTNRILFTIKLPHPQVGTASEAWHGPVFVRVFFTLVCHFLPVTPATLRKTLTAARIKMASPGIAALPTRAERKAVSGHVVRAAKLRAQRDQLQAQARVLEQQAAALDAERQRAGARVAAARREAWARAEQQHARRSARARAQWQERQAAKEAPTS